MSAAEAKQPVLLAVLAHPDDESFGMGGTLAMYAERGVQVHVVCATRGEAGEMDAEYLEGFASIPERREYELLCAIRELGVTELHLLDYRDSGMPDTPANRHPQALVNAPLEEVACKVAAYIRRLQPQVVVTFDPIGGYKHPDHIAIHKATLRAFTLAADPQAEIEGLPAYQPEKLYYHILPRGFLRFVVRILPLFGRNPREWGRNKDINLLELADIEFPTHAVIDYTGVRERKDRASACHSSQGGSAMIRGVMGTVLRLLRSKDRYMRAYPPPGQRIESDLFAGVGR